MAVTIVLVVVRLYGGITASWLTFDASAAASALAVPLLLGALAARSRERHGVQTRVNKLTQQDALTGLLSSAAFERQLKNAVSGAIMRKEAAAVAVVEVVNLQAIRQSYGDEMAEQCLLRAVIKLHRVVRDSDPAGRIGAGRFGLVLEGVRSRPELQDRMVRLVSAGLTPAKGAALDVPVQFHVACVLLNERVLTAPLILRELDHLLGRMSPRTRRPIRFLEPDEHRRPAVALAPESETMPASAASLKSSHGSSHDRSSDPDSSGPHR